MATEQVLFHHAPPLPQEGAEGLADIAGAKAVTAEKSKQALATGMAVLLVGKPVNERQCEGVAVPKGLGGEVGGSGLGARLLVNRAFCCWASPCPPAWQGFG